MSTWEERWLEHIQGLSRWELTAVINDCYSKANKLSIDYTDGKGREREIYKHKAKMAINLRGNLYG